MKKKLIASILAAVMVTSVVPATAFAASAPAKAAATVELSTEAKAVVDLIDKIPDPLAYGDAADIKTTRDAYDALLPAAQSEISAAELEKLENAEKKIAAFFNEKLADIAKEKIDTGSMAKEQGLVTDYTTKFTRLEKITVDNATYKAVAEIVNAISSDLSAIKTAGDAIVAVNATTYDTAETLITTFNSKIKDAKLSSEAAALLKVYADVTKKKIEIDGWAAEGATIASYTKKMKAITKIATEPELTAAEKVLADADAAKEKVDPDLKDIQSGEEFDNEYTRVQNLIDDAKGTLKTEKDAEAIEAKVRALNGKKYTDLNQMLDFVVAQHAYNVGTASGAPTKDLLTETTALENILAETKAQFEKLIGTSSADDSDFIAAVTTAFKNAPKEQAVVDAFNSLVKTDDADGLQTDCFGKQMITKNTGDIATILAIMAGVDAELTANKNADINAVKKVLTDNKITDLESVTGAADAPKDFAIKVANLRKAYDALTPAQKELAETNADSSFENSTTGKYVADRIKALEKLAAKISGSAEVTVEANAIAQMINALPAEKDLTLDHAKDVYAIRDRIAKGSDEIKELFKKGATGDYATYANLYNAALSKIDKLYVADLQAQINKLAIVKEDAPAADVAAAKAANEAARKAYKELTDTQQQEVDTARLVLAEKAVTAAEINAAETALKEVAKIDFTKDLTAEDAATIQAAKAAVEILTDAQKDKLDKDNLKIYTEKALPKLADAYDLAKATVAPIEAVTYNAKAQTPAVKITNALGAELKENDDFVVYYTDNKNAGKATVTIEGRGDYEKTKTETTFTINPRQLNEESASLAYVANKAYTGKQVKQTGAVVKWAHKTTLNKGYYTLSYKDNTKVGTATITATGRGNYAGTISKTFKINPAKEVVTVTKGTKKFTAKAAVAQSGVKYQFAWKASTAKTWKTWKTKYTTKTVTGLKSGKTYQVKVRAIKTVNGQTYYGAYSAVKTVKVK